MDPFAILACLGLMVVCGVASIIVERRNANEE